jgi:hypothetical protein
LLQVLRKEYNISDDPESRVISGANSGAICFGKEDLLDPDECARKANGLGDVTHVFFAAYREQPTEAAQVVTNGAMLRNLMTALEAVAAGLRHVNLMFDRLFRDLRQRKLIP